MLSDQPADKLHSQLDHSPHARATKIKGRQPVTHATRRMPPRAASPTAIWCACSTIAAPAWRRRGSATASAAAWCGCRRAPGSIPPDTGSNQPLEKHGNPNALTLDIGASKLSQGCIAQTCLVEIERYDVAAPAVTAHRLPDFTARG